MPNWPLVCSHKFVPGMMVFLESYFVHGWPIGAGKILHVWDGRAGFVERTGVHGQPVVFLLLACMHSSSGESRSWI